VGEQFLDGRAEGDEGEGRGFAHGKIPRARDGLVVVEQMRRGIVVDEGEVWVARGEGGQVFFVQADDRDFLWCQDGEQQGGDIRAGGDARGVQAERLRGAA